MGLKTFRAAGGQLGLLAALLVIAACSQSPGDAPSVESAPVAEFCSELPRPGWAAFEKHPASNDWFQVYRLAQGVFAISEPYQWQEVISYLIIGEERAVLFDTGNGIGDIKSVVNQLTDLPLTVLGSHSHFDHVGGHWQFDGILAPNTPFTKERALGFQNEDTATEVSPIALCTDLPEGVSPATHRLRPYKAEGVVSDGSLIDIGGRTLEVLMIPGHTDDSLALLDRKNGRIFTGDMYYKGPIWLFSPETDLAAYRASITRLAELVPILKSVHGAHNEPFSEPGELIKVRDGFEAILAGSKDPASEDGEQMVFEFESFDFIIRRDALSQS
ncbi:MAG: MBL fold metallo-hydrolase [Pseudomonadota bacterium]